MTEKKQVLDIEVTLSGQVKDKFLEIKRGKGLTDDAEVLKLIINEYFKEKLARNKQNKCSVSVS
jgi:hypothetical protein